MDIPPDSAEEFGDRLAVLEAAQDSYRVAVWEDEDGRIVAKCLDLEGVVTDGENRDAALANANEAISAYFESRGIDKQFNLAPEPRQ